MCGILGVVATSPVNQLLYDGLMVLQHRGQDAAGIATGNGDAFHMHKGSGLVRDVFRTRNMRALPGNMGIAHCRYPTAGSSSDSSESQPFYVNSPFGLVLAHNGNLTNTQQLQEEMFRQDLRHINTNSDSEALLNVLAHELQESAKSFRLDLDTIFAAVAGVHRRCKGAYAVVVLIAGYGLLAFRDPYGIRPLVIGTNETEKGTEYLLASESVALDTLGFRVLRDVAPGEAVFVDMAHQLHSRQCAQNPVLSPCIFEYVYLARPDSVIDGVSVYETRLRMGEKLADKVARELRVEDIDVVIPIPDSSRPSAMQLAQRLGIPYREGYVKNRYIGRTFIMPIDAQEFGAAETQHRRAGIPGQARAARRRLYRARHDQSRDRRYGARRRRAQGLFRFGGAARALPQRLWHRHADAQRADRQRAQRRRGLPRDRRRRAGLSGPRSAQVVGARTQAVAHLV
jgi:amidophosphoribosyltransferase